MRILRWFNRLMASKLDVSLQKIINIVCSCPYLKRYLITDKISRKNYAELGKRTLILVSNFCESRQTILSWNVIYWWEFHWVFQRILESWIWTLYVQWRFKALILYFLVTRNLWTEVKQHDIFQARP